MRILDYSLPETPARTCRVRVGNGALAALIDDLATRPAAGRVFVVADDRVAPLHAEPLCRRIAARGLHVRLLTFAAGEANKVRATKQVLEDRLFDSGADRDSVIVAVGGGVTGDLAGFLAATWQRGVPLVQVPTTLLAMVDAAIGGKTGVNLREGKNLVGAFHQPWGVYADPSVLGTLADEVYVEGFAEIVKGAVIADRELFQRLESGAEALRRRASPELEETIAASIAIKSAIVSADEREAGPRAALNFGHTVAHGVEVASGYAIRHGAAVAIGMRVEGELACRVHGFPRDELDRLSALLRELGLPVGVPPDLPVDRLVAATRRDKKARGGEARYALPLRIGELPPGPEVTVAVEETMLEGLLSELIDP